MSIWRDEVFGPAIAVIEVDGLEQAVEAVNDSQYGLSAAVFTQRHRRCRLLRGVRRIPGRSRSTCRPRAGMCTTRSAASSTRAPRSRSRGSRPCASTLASRPSPSGRLSSKRRFAWLHHELVSIGAGIIGLAVARRLTEVEPGVRADGAREGEPGRRPPDRAQQRRRARRRLLHAGVAEGAALPARDRVAQALLRAARYRLRGVRQADRRARPR